MNCYCSYIEINLTTDELVCFTSFCVSKKIRECNEVKEKRDGVGFEVKICKR